MVIVPCDHAASTFFQLSSASSEYLLVSRNRRSASLKLITFHMAVKYCAICETNVVSCNMHDERSVRRSSNFGIANSRPMDLDEMRALNSVINVRTCSHMSIPMMGT